MNRAANPFETGLDKNAANLTPLSPLSFLPRTAAVYPEATALVHGSIRRSWAETYGRCRRLASALRARGIGTGDTVAVMAPNTPAVIELHVARTYTVSMFEWLGAHAIRFGYEVSVPIDD